MNEQQPLISCLCVTKERPHYLVRAIRSFLAQSYPSKELVVLHPKWDTSTSACVSRFGVPELRAVALDAVNATLGELRNISIDHARGDYLCVWDDDDWHSPERIAALYGAIASSRKQASILARLLIYDARSRSAYLGFERLWENSVMFSKKKISELGIRYPAKNRSEDYDFVNELIAANLIYPVYDPTLYIYQISGNNTCDARHFDALLKRSVALSTEHAALVRQAIELSISPGDAHRLLQSDWFKSPLQYVKHTAVPRV